MEMIQRYCADCAAQVPIERIKDGFITYRCTCCRKATTEVYKEPVDTRRDDFDYNAAFGVVK